MDRELTSTKSALRKNDKRLTELEAKFKAFEEKAALARIDLKINIVDDKFVITVSADGETLFHHSLIMVLKVKKGETELSRGILHSLLLKVRKMILQAIFHLKKNDL